MCDRPASGSRSFLTRTLAQCGHALLAAGILLAIAGTAGAAPKADWKKMPPRAGFELAREADAEPVPLRWAGGWVLARVKINGTDAGWFKIATGWKYSMIHTETAVRLGLPTLPEFGLLTQARKPGAGTGAQVVRVDRLECGGAVAAELPLECADLAGLSQEVVKMYGEGISGVLGWDLLKSLPFLLDEPALRMTWRRQAAPPAGAVRLDLTEKFGCPFAGITLGDDCRVEAMVNSAAVSVAVQRPLLERHAESLWHGPLIAIGSTFHGARADDDNLPLGEVAGGLPMARWLEVAYGDTREMQPVSLSPRTNPETGEVQIGYGLCRRRQVWFDGPGRAMWLSAATTVPEIAVAGLPDPNPYLLTVALQTAVDFNDPEAVRALAGAGADLKGLPLQEPLPRACSFGSREAARALIEAGAPAEPAVDQPGLPLLAACESGDAELVKFLLEKGAVPERGNRSGFTPLQAAARNGDPAVLKALRAKTGLPEKPEALVRLLGEAAAGGNLDLAKEILEKIPAELRPGLEWPLLLEQVLLIGRPEMAAWVLKIGGDGLVAKPIQLPPLVAALVPTRIEKTEAVRGELVTLLLEAGADPNASGKGITPLLVAARHGNAAIIRQLLEAGAKATATDVKQRNALLRAAAANQPVETVAALLETKLDRDAIDSETEMTALATYAQHGNVPACRALLAAGAGVEVASLFGPTPLCVAASGSRSGDGDALAVVRLLVGHEAKAGTRADAEETPGALFGAIVAGRSSLIKPLVGAGAPLEQRVANVTPLGWACAMAEPATVKALLDAGADPRASDRTGVTPMGHAAAAGRLGNLRVLLEKGLPPDAEDDQGMPPLWLAAAAGQTRAVRLLLAAGAKPDACHPRQRTTALDAARARRDKSLAEVLEAAAKP